MSQLQDTSRGGDDASGDHQDTLRFERSWRSFTSVQGGVVLGRLMSRAAGVVAAGGPTPTVRAVSAHFLSGVAVDVDTYVEARPDRSGTTSSVRSEIWQDDALRAVAQVLLVRSPSAGTRHDDQYASAATLGRPDAGEPFELPRDFVPVGQHYEIRALGSERPLGGGSRPRLAAWVRLRHVTGLDPLVQLGVVVDALPPSLFAVLTAPRPMATIELSMHVFSAPPPSDAWFHIEQTTEWANDDLCVDAAVLHDEHGDLVARARQTRRITHVP